jgi:hypothetical protein
MPAKSKKQQRYMGMLYHCKETGDCPNDDVKDKAKRIKKKVVRDFAETKHKSLPEKVKKKRREKKRKKKSRSMNVLESLYALNVDLNNFGFKKESTQIKRIIKMYVE